MDEKTDQLVRRHVKTSGESTSRWIAEAVRQRARTEWPAEVLAVFRTWGDDVPEGAALRKSYGKDIPRWSFWLFVLDTNTLIHALQGRRRLRDRRGHA